MTLLIVTESMSFIWALELFDTGLGAGVALLGGGAQEGDGLGQVALGFNQRLGLGAGLVGCGGFGCRLPGLEGRGGAEERKQDACGQGLDWHGG